MIAVKASLSEMCKGIRGSPSVSAIEVMAMMATFYKKKEKSAELGFFTASLTPMTYPSEMENIIQEIGQKAAPVCFLYFLLLEKQQLNLCFKAQLETISE